MGLERRTDEEYIRLLDERFGWRVEGPSYVSAPQPKQEYVWWNSVVKSSVEQLERFLLRTYVIIDGFGIDHSARLQALEQLAQDDSSLHDWVYTHSKLRGNNILGSIVLMTTIEALVGRKFSGIGKELKKIIDDEELLGPVRQSGNVPIRYNSMDLNEKLAYAARLDKAVYEFLQVLSK